MFISHESGTEAAVYRLRNSKAAEHLYTTDPHEVDVLCDQYGWESDNNGAPVFYDSTPSEGLDSPQADEVGNYVYRLYNSKSGLHLLTNDHNELITLTQGGWNTDDFFGESHMFYAIFPDKAAEAGVMQ